MARAALITAAVVEIVFRGIPALIGTPEMAGVFGLEFLPGFVPYVHAFGAVMLTFGILFLIAAKVPERNLLIINMAILRFFLGILAQLWTFIQMGELHIFWWVHMVVDAILVLYLIAARTKMVEKIA
ncbi:MAG: hypothetical protein ABIE42_11720 [Candidatus Eisenbacteria bacterium]